MLSEKTAGNLTCATVEVTQKKKRIIKLLFNKKDNDKAEQFLVVENTKCTITSILKPPEIIFTGIIIIVSFHT